MFQWVKKGVIFNPSQITGRPGWMYEFAQAPNAVIFEKFIRVFFSTRPKPDEKKQFVSRCAFFDLDRKDLSKVINISKQPVLELGGLGSFDEYGTYPVSVIPENGLLFAYYGGWTRCQSVPFNISIGCAESKDNGETFYKTGNGPVLSFSLNEPFVITSPKIRKYSGTWYLFYTAGKEWFIKDNRPEIIYTLRLATSVDGINWQKHDQDIMPNRLGCKEAQACPDVLYTNGKYHMFFCYRQGIDFRRNKNNTYRIGYASSTDLLNWHRDDSKAGIDISDDGFDNEMVAYPHVFKVDDKIYMLYLGNEVGRYGIGLAELEGELN